MGGHRGRRRRRADRAVPLLRVQAALPVRDHGPGDRGLPLPLRGADDATAPTRWSASWPSSRTASSSPSATSSATACWWPSRGCCPPAATRRARSRRGRPRGRARATSSSPGPASSRTRCSRARSRRTTRGCSRARSSASTTASGTGTARTGSSPCNRIAEFFTDRSLALIGVAPEALGRREGRGMSFFERYFAALDGPDPHSSLELVAEDVEFSIQWARGDRSRQPPVRRRPRGAARASSTPAT